MMQHVSAEKKVVVLIIISTALRIILSCFIGLGVDESYVASIARFPAMSYFDHPPLHFWLVWAAARLTGSEADVVLRLPFILLFAGTTWLMFLLSRRLFGSKAGFWASLLLNVSAVFSLSTGSWILPDGPLMFFLLLAANAIIHILFETCRPLRWEWITAGLWLGLGLLSKYHAVFFMVGLGLFLLTSRRYRHWLAQPGPYLAAAAALAVFIPVIWWNADHNWISFLFQGGRGTASGFFPERLLPNIVGQAAWILPWIWLPLVWTAGQAVVRARDDARQNGRWLLCCWALGPIVCFTGAVLWGAQGLFHWQAPGYLFLFPLLGEATAENSGRRAIKWWTRISVTCFFLLVLLLGSHTATGWMRTAVPHLFLTGDPTVEALDWRDLPTALAEMNGTENSDFIVAGDWIDAAKIDYSLGGRMPVLCLSNAPHHFAFLHSTNAMINHNALIIGRPDIIGDGAGFQSSFSSLERLGTIAIRRFGYPELELTVIRAKGFRGYSLPYGQ